jgi:hypothetical protein
MFRTGLLEKVTLNTEMKDEKKLTVTCWWDNFHDFSTNDGKSLE